MGIVLLCHRVVPNIVLIIFSHAACQVEKKMRVSAKKSAFATIHRHRLQLTINHAANLKNKYKVQAFSQ
jgi:hypothetical protein